MARSFTETEKDHIREKLIIECEKNWALFGYKKTSIDELCMRVGISKGAFYFFFDSKEQLFCHVLDICQERIINLITGGISTSSSKESVCQILKQVYQEYNNTNILTQRNNPDFINFLNKAPQDWKEKSKVISDHFIADTLFNASLQLKMSKEKAIGIFNALLSIALSKDLLGYDHFDVFGTLLDSVIHEIYD